ncbi:MAG: methylenetetrahydrofolate--tRNA-(uracil(54)-C(5))-methyltransferase (FADH(2)-oxidizing) TrmFO [Chitinispirillaceae bacterium]|nr:methylenetetrahydrofolate--tRNA-(uracil(54)-C(5))-methyltransferase (FADH(2)-oxidizing) TrmFO [Chitinispirillaceae bacterium]
MTDTPHAAVAVIGAGLAGCEAALVLSRRGIPVALYEARPQCMTPAHTTALPAELVCSNSLKSDALPSAHGLLKAELRTLESPLLAAATETALPAGSALAVDRERFSLRVRELITASPLVSYILKEVEAPPPCHRYCVIAAGPLASEKLTSRLQQTFSTGALHFYDAIAPIVAADSIDHSIAFPASRWKKGEGDYLNCPFSEEEYRVFFDTLREADRVTARNFEEARFFESCLPIEVAAERGYKALAFGPLRPVGLIDPRTGRRPFAVCQLRRERASGESYNLVGFQTRLTIREQQRVFRLIPGFARAEFLRYGSIHRNTYLDSPALLRHDLSFRQRPDLFCAGQLCGNEGYTESIATGHLAASAVASRIAGHPWAAPPVETALGALLHHVTASKEHPFTPSNIHFGLFPPLDTVPVKRKPGKKEKQERMCERALMKIREWISSLPG